MNTSTITELYWSDEQWMESRGQCCKLDRPISVYEVHLDSWMRVPEDGNRPLTCNEIAPKLADYVRRMNFTHVAILSPNEFPFHGEQEDLMSLVNQLHQQDIGVILDLPDRTEPLMDLFELYHADGLRQGDFILMADGGQPFKLKADYDWTNAILGYLGRDPIYRKYYHERLTARAQYAFSDNFILSLSHDEVIAGKSSLLQKMQGDNWRKFANLRLLVASMCAQPGKKLIFMGGEFGQWQEWNPGTSLDWHLVQDGNPHRGIQRCVADLNLCYRREPAFHQTDANPDGFEWADFSDKELSAVSWLRHSARAKEVILAVFNFTPVPRQNYRIGVPGGGFWKEIFNSDAREYGGSGQGNVGGLEASPLGWQCKTHSLTLTLPPLSASFFKRET